MKRVAVIVACATVTLASFTAERSAGALATQVWVMPAHQNGGASVADYGLHFDDYAGLGAYDYSGSLSLSTPVYVRAMAPVTQAYPVRYWYFLAEDCRVRARMQRLVAGTWVTDYDHDIDILHVSTASVSSGYTSAVSSAGQWLASVVANPGYCGTSALHLHMAMRPSAYVAVVDKTDDTCWANGSECSVMGGKSVGLHGPSATSCPGYRVGSTINRSGGVGYSPSWIPYSCQNWSLRWRSPDTPAFEAH
ncbi:MAG: hypothetical protein KatS3mg063_2442 [Tepidiforma sp.]|jgi:hypothetical protein|uniref:Peptidase M23 domain-containing protein n=1 Tax=Tepidiforma thermophila (strain KCTC 52669 / CGMCC 1.13589 / G233) TaxID=2761530 RepID=A0A2A9HJ69_TEPT2|nr:hypothetical protein A9A59_2446 [Tepidiforma thermophila]GIW13334.1 MAG: hypothetical protein KatS3mg062_0773 [Tepidiforma sp.]GIW16589.1 MAG: hypothetical protein KatS3mg063_2442 [Tepidiforma sp.]